MQSLSVLIAAYNCNCLPLVEQLLPMLQNNLEAYEVIVSDDATADPEITKANEAINQLPGCRYILKPKNAGSAANRNYLGAISQYPLLLFLDCDEPLGEGFADDFVFALGYTGACGALCTGC